MDKVTVKVPATSANIGPGFDSVGCALTLYNTVIFERIPIGLIIEGCADVYKTENNLTIVAYKRTLKALNLPFDGIKVSIYTSIPSARGLGSSAAMIVAGVMGANALNGSPLNQQQILSICTEIEGHPDNIAPAIYGGLTASIMEGTEPYTVKYNIHPKWNFTALVPRFRLSTAKARAALPSKVAFRDASYNVSHVAVMLKALENGDEMLLKKAINDKLHQPYRKGLIDEYDKIESAALQLGATAFYLSGAGPTLMCISTATNFNSGITEAIKRCQNCWDVVPLNVDTSGSVILAE